MSDTSTSTSVGADRSEWPQGSFVTSVERSLRTFIASQQSTIDAVGPIYAEAAEELAAFVLRGGKRIRPAFAWTGWIGAGGDPHSVEADAALDVFAALEFVQGCALVHDDIIDCSSTRRGFPTVHVTFAERHRAAGWSGDSDKYGESVAIILGDLALTWADDLVRFAALDADAARRLTPVWSAMRTEVLGGQLLDIAVEARGDDSLEAALQIDRYKTAAYTVERPLLIGAALAGAGEDLQSVYSTFGADIGVAFQLRDDLLGVFGDPAVTGKPSGDDLREGKRTVLMAAALGEADRSAPAAAARLRAGLGTDISDEEVDVLRAHIVDLGAVEDVERRITALTESALAALDASNVTADAKARLTAMAYTATRRSS
ncbi:geranylgeranyl pyrophosphate synthase [Rhodococcus sp. Leaf7]|uniref:polyprenyl synthetase family protein n=1 Tax=unclassified Rhodococcus (in: high G+C Gram-positive bacteria) TaxID=192944 RepID=UPI0006F32278|nr:MULTISPECIES: polyprenyl synthetase family protein [unclassified Rhodococcus (in: high G+C Gram-positive bacteria)]KQU02637.1 geranylgeranyl pyrophosphate synthase [Rhodococcus sp. Leaf7]KQU38109.1 geranylgeranyl pyrophosphate synthase [Rhodococcus sp. Leaf247]